MTSALRTHVRRLWPGWRVLLPLPFPLWGLLRVGLGSARWEHLSLLAVAPLLAFSSAKTKRFFVGLYPLLVLAVVYDSMFLYRYVGVTAARVHLCDLRALDMRLFGLRIDGVTVSVHDWLQAHGVPVLDALCAIPYGTFLYVSIAFAIFLYRRDYDVMRRFGWIFLAVNLLGFVTYHIYPAAPPWYYHAHGCAVDLAAHASEGPNLARVDAWTHFPLFRAFYGRSNDVFGAVPSLHVTYPLLVALYGYRYFGWTLRVASIAYFVLMCFAAVYLDHHWVLDVLLGIAYVFGVELVQQGVRRWLRRAATPDRAGLLEVRTR